MVDKIANPVGCAAAAASEIPGEVAAAAGDSVLDKLMSIIATTTVNMANGALSSWMDVPSMNPLTTGYSSDEVPADPELWAPLSTMWDSLAWVTVLVAVAGMIFAITRAAITNRAEGLASVPRMMFNVIAVSTFGVVALWTGIQSTDVFSKWLMKQAATSAGGEGDALQGFVTTAQITSLSLVAGGLIGLLVTLGSIAQILFMVLRGALLVILIAVWPTVAASTTTEAGSQAFKKINMWLIALILYKPAAAVIYSLGMLVMSKSLTTRFGNSSDEFMSALMHSIYGVTILLLAVLALPALIKFLSPPAGVGASNAFSGAAALGVVATGAAAVASGGAMLGAGAGAGATGAATTPALQSAPQQATSQTPPGSSSPPQGGSPPGSDDGSPGVPDSGGQGSPGSEGSTGSDGSPGGSGQEGAGAGQGESSAEDSGAPPSSGGEGTPPPPTRGSADGSGSPPSKSQSQGTPPSKSAGGGHGVSDVVRGASDVARGVGGVSDAVEGDSQ